MSNIILVVDGENFKYKVESVFKEEKIDRSTIDYTHININGLIKNALWILV